MGRAADARAGVYGVQRLCDDATGHNRQGSATEHRPAPIERVQLWRPEIPLETIPPEGLLGLENVAQDSDISGKGAQKTVKQKKGIEPQPWHCGAPVLPHCHTAHTQDDTRAAPGPAGWGMIPVWNPGILKI